MRILVTGGTGFIGREVVTAVNRRGHDVVLLSRRPTPTPPGAARVAHIDLSHPDGLVDALSGVDAVVHCAAAMSGDLAAQRAVTVTGTRNLLAAMQDAGVRRLTMLGSFAVYDCRALDVGSVVNESSPVESQSAHRAPYIRAKLEQEALVRELPEQDGWRWTIVRPGIVHGPGRRWFHHLGIQLTTSQWICLAGAAPLPLCHVTSCADAVALAAELAPATGLTLNLVDNDLPSRRAYVDAIAARLPVSPTIHDIPWSVLDRAGRVADWINRSLLGERLPLPDLLDPSSLAARCKPLTYSNESARDALGWTPANGLATDRDPTT